MPLAFRQAIRSLASVTVAPTPTLVKIVLKPASESGVD